MRNAAQSLRLNGDRVYHTEGVTPQESLRHHHPHTVSPQSLTVASAVSLLAALAHFHRAGYQPTHNPSGGLLMTHMRVNLAAAVPA